jgi:hypothetical protein
MSYVRISHMRLNDKHSSIERQRPHVIRGQFNKTAYAEADIMDFALRVVAHRSGGLKCTFLSKFALPSICDSLFFKNL